MTGGTQATITDAEAAVVRKGWSKGRAAAVLLPVLFLVWLEAEVLLPGAFFEKAPGNDVVVGGT